MARNRDMLGKYNDIDFSKRGIYMDYDKEGNLRTEGNVTNNQGNGKYNIV